MADVLEINTIAALADYRHFWHNWLDQTPGATFFHSLEWLEAYWRHFGEARRLRALVVHHEGRPIGVVPLVVVRERTRVGWLRVLTYPLHDWGSFYGPVGPDPRAILGEAMAYLRCSPRDWDTMDLRWVDPEAASQVVPEAMGAAGLRPLKTVWDTTAVVDLEGTWDDYLATRPGRWRNAFRRWERRLRQAGGLEFVRYRPMGEDLADADPRWDLFDACQRIAARSWQARSTTGTTLCHTAVRDFVRDAHAAAARLGCLDLNLLLLDGQPAAFAYNYRFRNTVYGLRIGFDPGLSRAGTGSLLCTYSIRDSFLRGDRLYDMGAGYMTTKRHWMTRQVPIYRFSHFPWTAPRAQLLRLKRWLQGRHPVCPDTSGTELPPKSARR